jgi:hypothetical protein
VAARVPELAWEGIAAAATLAAIGFAFLYAYDQDVLFPDRHFPRTWVLVATMAGVGVAALVPFQRLGIRHEGVAAFIRALGAAMLIFGGANLANRGTGLAVLAAGAVAWVAVAAIGGRRGASSGAVVLGSGAAAALTFAVVAVCVLAVSGTA